MVLASEPEFEQAVHEISSTLGPFLQKNPEYKKALEVAQIPERVIQFRVVWEDDAGNMQANRGYRVQVCPIWLRFIKALAKNDITLVQLIPWPLQRWPSFPPHRVSPSCS